MRWLIGMWLIAAACMYAAASAHLGWMAVCIFCVAVGCTVANRAPERGE